ncbi:hypothetical protein [Amycolatopsis sp. H20-H5]|uniref:hypothetical protein n=1 Tax=Amycolatopsis sp. H20-H5 TaxID=3046309 RepID=UPI002DC04CF9|nr:hypothetical protein [Amycolatopsis sp. H20-H5]MEC3974662.1 hypothetical protein [Amycolatopsis sp. H20-H5]
MAACCVLSACTAGQPDAPGPSSPAAPFTQPQPPPAGLPGAAADGISVRLLLPTSPPSVFDADTGKTARVAGAPGGNRSNYVIQAGKHPVLVSAPVCQPTACTTPSDVLAYSAADGSVQTLGKALSAAPTADGEGVWLIRDDGNDNCRLQRVSFAGVQTDAGQSASCGTTVRTDGPKGLLIRVNDGTQSYEDVLIDPVTGRTVQQAPHILGLIGNRLLIEELSGFTVLDLDTGTKVALKRPGTDGQASDLLPSPDGRRAAIQFGVPSWRSTSTQVVDVWVLDLDTPQWLQAPSMPYSGDLKHCALDWSGAGDLVLADTVVAAWHPGEPSWRLAKAPLPPERGSTIAVLR